MPVIMAPNEEHKFCIVPIVEAAMPAIFGAGSRAMAVALEIRKLVPNI